MYSLLQHSNLTIAHSITPEIHIYLLCIHVDERAAPAPPSGRQNGLASPAPHRDLLLHPP